MEDSAPNETYRITNALSVPVVVLDRTGGILFTNRAWESSLARFGVNPAPKVIGMNYLDTFSAKVGAKGGRIGMDPPPFPYLANTAEASVGLTAVLTGESQETTFELLLPTSPGHPDGTRFVVDAGALPGEEGGALLSHRIEEKALTTQNLYRNRSLFRDILTETRDLVFLCSPTDRLLLANGNLARWVALGEHEMMGKKVSKVFPADVSRMLLEKNHEVIETGQTISYETSVATSKGVRILAVTKGVHRTPKGRVKGVFGIAHDISGVRAMEREIIDTSDKEKQRLGQELHENLCQYLVGISLLGNVLYEELLRLELKQAQDARQITSLVKEAITEVRSLVKGLSTMPLEQEEGLVAALHDLAEQARIIGKIRCSLRVPRRADFLDPSVTVHLFRIAQEAVHNAIKHAGATRLQISLANRARAVVLTVKDNGIGFTDTRPQVADLSSGLGLHIMHYRSRAIGAQLDITTRTDEGTTVTCTLPKES